MFAGLPGGSPGPGASASWKGVLVVFLLALVSGALIFWLFWYVAEVTS